MPIEKHLPKQHFDHLIRIIKTASFEVVKQIRTAAFITLKRLNVKRQKSKARHKIPKGSDQIDIQSIIVWMNKVQACDTKAVEQIVILDATACIRMEA